MKSNLQYYFFISGAIIISFACLGFWIYFLTNIPDNTVFTNNPDPPITTVELGLLLAVFIVGIRTLFRGAFACGLAVLVASVGSVMVADQLVSLWEFGALGYLDGQAYAVALASLLIVVVSLTSQIKQWRWPGQVSPLVQRGFLALVLASAVILSALYLTINRPIPVSTEQVRTFTQEGVQFQVSGPAIVQVGQPVEMTIRLTNNRSERIGYSTPLLQAPAPEISKRIVKSYFRGFYMKAVPTTEFGKNYQSRMTISGGKEGAYLLPGQSKEWKVDFSQLVIMDRGLYIASFSLDDGVGFSAGGRISCSIDNIRLVIR